MKLTRPRPYDLKLGIERYVGHDMVFWIVTGVFVLWICASLYVWMAKQGIGQPCMIGELWLGRFYVVYLPGYFISYYHSRNRIVL